jgi:hypothetical protein
MALTYTLIASSTVGSGGVSSITFSSIAGTYTDLLVKVSARSSAASSQLLVTVNGLTTGYSGKRLQGTGAAALSDSTNTINLNPVGSVSSSFTANTFSNADIYISNYANASFKSFSMDGTSENNATESYLTFVAGLSSNTAAVTSIGLAPTSGTLVQYSTAYLYGIKNS